MKLKRGIILKIFFTHIVVLMVLLHPILLFGQSNTISNGSNQSSEIQIDTVKKIAGNENFFEQKYITGDWWGARSLLENRGINFDLRYSSTYQGLIAGTGQKSFDYGGKVNALINLETDKMRLWKGGNFNFHLEYRHGAAQTNPGGTIFAVNTALFLPSDSPTQLVATSINYTQKIGNGHRISIGKFNPIDVYASDPFYGGWGVDRFMNVVLVAPPSGLIPVVFMGAITSINLEPVTLTAIVFDPNDRTNDYFPGDLFKDGVTIGANATAVTKLAGRRTSYGITGFYSTAEGTDYSTLGGGVINTSTKTGAFNINVQFKHNLQESSEHPDAAWGLSFKAGIADGNPNYVKSSVVVGIGGRPLFFGRHQDSFGVGYFYYNLSDVLEDSFNPLVSITDESGLEIFYTYAITPWLYISADLQYINPFRERFKNAFIGGLRTQIRI
ncbi:carbohydrate porin [Bacteroidota bacterium]|jgi:porin